MTIRNLIVAVDREIKNNKSVDEAVKIIADKFGLAMDGNVVKFLYHHFYS